MWLREMGSRIAFNSQGTFGICISDTLCPGRTVKYRGKTPARTGEGMGTRNQSAASFKPEVSSLSVNICGFIPILFFPLFREVFLPSNTVPCGEWFYVEGWKGKAFYTVAGGVISRKYLLSQGFGVWLCA